MKKKCEEGAGSSSAHAAQRDLGEGEGAGVADLRAQLQITQQQSAEREAMLVQKIESITQLMHEQQQQQFQQAMQMQNQMHQFFQQQRVFQHRIDSYRTDLQWTSITVQHSYKKMRMITVLLVPNQIAVARPVQITTIKRA